MVQRKRQDDGLTDEQYLDQELSLRRLHVALPVTALVLALIGVAVVLGRSLGPPKGSPDQGVRKIAPEVPSATPHVPKPCSSPAPAPSVEAVDPPAPPRVAHAHRRRRS